MQPDGLKERVRKLRGRGYTYREIQNAINTRVAKSTLSLWCKDIALSPIHDQRINRLVVLNLHKARALAISKKTKEKEEARQHCYNLHQHLPLALNEPSTAKIALAILYAAEGTKGIRRTCITFGNSDKRIIKLFLKLLRFCFPIEEAKLRFTVQCRADQNMSKLVQFWADATQIPLTQCYKTQIDKRTVGKPSKKLGYMGVCRIDYLSSSTYNELQVIIDLLIQ